MHQRQPVAVGQAKIDKADIGRGARKRGLKLRGARKCGGAKSCFGQGFGQECANLRLAYTRRDGKAAIMADLEMVYDYFPRLKERRTSQAGYTSGGEQQMTAIGRALMSRPETILLDVQSMGLAPQLVEQIFGIVKRLNEEQGVTFLLAAPPMSARPIT